MRFALIFWNLLFNYGTILPFESKVCEISLNINFRMKLIFNAGWAVREAIDNYNCLPYLCVWFSEILLGWTFFKLDDGYFERNLIF